MSYQSRLEKLEQVMNPKPSKVEVKLRQLTNPMFIKIHLMHGDLLPDEQGRYWMDDQYRHPQVTKEEWIELHRDLQPY